MIKCVIYDFDGTLADTERFSLNIYNELAEKYGYRTYTLEDLEELKQMPLTKLISMVDIPYHKIFSLIREGQGILKKHINDVKGFQEDLAATLEQIKEMTGQAGVISSNSKKNIKRFLKNKEIHTMDFVISSPLFSKEAKISKIMRKEDLRPGEVLYVGDEVRDIQSSQKAGIRVAAATWGYQHRSLLEDARPTYLIDNLRELITIVKNLNGAM